MQRVTLKIAINLMLWLLSLISVNEGQNVTVRHRRYDETLPSLLKIKYHHEGKVNLVVLKKVWDSTLTGTLMPMRYIDRLGELSEEHLPYQNPIALPTFYHGVNSFAALTYFPRTQTLHGVLDHRVYVDNLPLRDVENPDSVDEFIRLIPSGHGHSSNTRDKRGTDRKMKQCASAEPLSTKKFKGNDQKKTLYPEIFLIVDIPSERVGRRLRTRYERDMMYVLSYWNAVDLLFRNLKRTEIRINIAGMLIVQKQHLEASELVNSQHIKTHNEHIFISRDPALVSLGTYFHDSEIIKRDSFDFLIWMTSTTLVHADAWYQEIDELLHLKKDYTGAAAPADCGGLHLDEVRDKKTSNRAIIVHDNEYSRYHTAARGIAYLMFVTDDNVPAPHGRYYPQCSSSNQGIGSSSIMDPLHERIGDYPLWSYCSEILFEKYSRSKSSCCLLNYPSRTLDMPEPPYFLSVDSQCECYGMRAHDSMHYRFDICNKHLACKNNEGQNVWVAMPLDGTPCLSVDVRDQGDNFCNHNDCV